MSKPVFEKIKNGLFPEPEYCFSKSDAMSVASTHESVDISMDNEGSMMAVEPIFAQSNSAANGNLASVSYSPRRDQQECLSLGGRFNMPSFIRFSSGTQVEMNGGSGDGTFGRTPMTEVARVSLEVPVVRAQAQSTGTSGSMIVLGKTPRISESITILEPGEAPRISDQPFLESSPETMSIKIDALPYDLKKRAAPIMEVHTLFEEKCITSGLLNKSQATTLKRIFEHYLREILPVINSDLRYQHSEPVAAVLLMSAWETLKLPIKIFLKTIDACTKKELGRIGIIRKCKAFAVVKKLKHQVDQIFV